MFKQLIHFTLGQTSDKLFKKIKGINLWTKKLKQKNF